MSAALDRCVDAIILIPGVMGSELVRDGAVVWGMSLGLVLRQAALGDVLARIRLPPDGSDDGIRASREIQLPMRLPMLSGAEPYAKLLLRLRTTALRPEAVRVFPYDWRRSIVHAAQELTGVAERHLAAWRSTWASLSLEERRGLPEPMLTLVGHSMGGLVGRWFAEVLGGRAVVRQLLTLGTPFAGSLNALRVLADGDYLPFRVLATALRDAGRTFPGLYELVPRYCCVSDSPDPSATGAGAKALRAIAADDAAAIGASREMAEAAFSVHRQLQDKVLEAGTAACPLRTLVGVRQPTAQTVTFEAGTALFAEQLDGVDYRGDGTVYRYAAAPRGVQPFPLPQSHGSLARSDEALAFVEAALTERDLGEVQAPEGFGVRVPEAVRPGAPFWVVGIDGQEGAMAVVTEVEANQELPVATAPLYRRPDHNVAAEVALPRPGVYRVTVMGGGYSPVEHLVVGLAED